MTMRALQVVAQLARHDVVLGVDAVRVGGEQHAQPVAHRQAGRDDKEGVGEAGRVLRGDLGEPDGGFGGFDLAEEEAALARGVAPVLEQAGGDGRDGGAQPRGAEGAPGRDLAADLVDVVVRLALAEVVFEVEAALVLHPVLRRGHRGDELAAASPLGREAHGDAILVEHPMARRRGEGAVENWIVDDRSGHWGSDATGHNPGAMRVFFKGGGS